MWKGSLEVGATVVEEVSADDVSLSLILALAASSLATAASDWVEGRFGGFPMASFAAAAAATSDGGGGTRGGGGMKALAVGGDCSLSLIGSRPLEALDDDGSDCDDGLTAGSLAMDRDVVDRLSTMTIVVIAASSAVDGRGSSGVLMCAVVGAFSVSLELSVAIGAATPKNQD